MEKKFDIVVTRHPALLEYLKMMNMLAEDAKVLKHAEAEDVRGKHVCGVLPHSLSSLTASFTEIPLKVPPELRGRELSLYDIYRYAGKPVTYIVRKIS